MSEYEFDAVRWLRNNAQVAANYENNAMAIYLTECADEIQRLRAENATLRKESEFYRAQCDMRDEWRDKVEAELAALKEAVRPVVRGWGMVKQQGEYAALNCAGSGYRLAAEQLDALAALVREK